MSFLSHARSADFFSRKRPRPGHADATLTYQAFPSLRVTRGVIASRRAHAPDHAVCSRRAASGVCCASVSQHCGRLSQLADSMHNSEMEGSLLGDFLSAAVKIHPAAAPTLSLSRIVSARRGRRAVRGGFDFEPLICRCCSDGRFCASAGLADACWCRMAVDAASCLRPFLSTLRRSCLLDWAHLLSARVGARSARRLRKVVVNQADGDRPPRRRPMRRVRPRRAGRRRRRTRRVCWFRAGRVPAARSSVRPGLGR